MKNTLLNTLVAGASAGAVTWCGTNRLHDPHTNRPEDSPSTLTVTPVIGGRFVRLDYSWAYQGASQEGSLLLGCDPETREMTAHWADTWHMDRKMMICRGIAEEGEENCVALRGSYSAPPGPDWGWRIELALDAAGALGLRMFNVTPDGKSAPAVEADYTRVPQPNTAGRQAGTEHRLGEIGQIAVTVADVGQAVAFYRDVLGLRFLFSPAPTLAFFAAGRVRIMLTRPEGAGGAGANSILYYLVENVEAVHEAIVRRGAKSERPPQLTARMPDHELWMGFIRDPDGNLIGLMEEKRGGT